MPPQERTGAVREEIELCVVTPEELKLNDRLAIERTIWAADRSMLAGVRTSLSFIGFGFTIYNVLRYLQQNTSTLLMRPQTPRNFGLFMFVLGTVPLLFMIIQYYRILRRLGAKGSVVGNPNFQMAIAVLFLGVTLLITLLLNIMLK